MTLISFKPIFTALMAGGILCTGCGRQENASQGRDPDHDHEAEAGHGGHEHAHEHGHGPEHGGQSPSGASYKAGRGVTVTAETRGLIGVEVADVAEREVAQWIRATAQIFGEEHHHTLPDPGDHRGCDVHGSGLISTEAAALVKPGGAVEVLKVGHAPMGGVVLAVHRAFASGESEVVIGVSNAMAVLKAGEFVPVRIRVPRAGAVVAVPESSLLRTVEGTFVYAVNGDSYFKTAVKTGAESDGWVEVADGLLSGDQVVTRAVEDLWLVELRATKGGGHSH